MASYMIAPINNYEDGKLFFDTYTYNIPYQVIIRGENKGKLRVKKIRLSDGDAVLKARKDLEYVGYRALCDHSNVFRDEDDRPVITFSPYHDVIGTINLPGYEVKVSD